MHFDLLVEYLLQAGAQVPDPIPSEMIGQIKSGGTNAMLVIRSVVVLICVASVIFMSYNVFFGNSKDGIISLLLTFVIASIVTAITFFFT